MHIQSTHYWTLAFAAVHTADAQPATAQGLSGSKVSRPHALSSFNKFIYFLELDGFTEPLAIIYLELDGTISHYQH